MRRKYAEAIRVFERLGYGIVRQRGSHIRCAMRLIPRESP
jgi:predicted RNA binding protein YcfA (HicA-like mRNA interferase family)